MSIGRLFIKTVCWIGGHTPMRAITPAGYGYCCRLCGTVCDYRGEATVKPEVTAAPQSEDCHDPDALLKSDHAPAPPSTADK